MVEIFSANNHLAPTKKILILAANPKTTPRRRLDKEIHEIREGLRRAKHSNQFEMCAKSAVNYRAVRRAMLEYEPQIVHFIGYGKEKGIFLEGEQGLPELTAGEPLSELFEMFSDQVECVILSSCYSVHQANAIQKHIKYVIGMEREINDKASIEFAVGFYDALGAGRSIESAFKFGCNAIRQLFPETPEHLNPVLKKRNGVDGQDKKHLGQVDDSEVLSKKEEKSTQKIVTRYHEPADLGLEKRCNKRTPNRPLENKNKNPWETGPLEGLDFLDKKAIADDRLIFKISDRRGIGTRKIPPFTICDGQFVSIEYESDFKGHIILIELDPDGYVNCLRPSSFMPATTVFPGNNVLTPSPIEVSYPFGTYKLFAIFVTENVSIPWTTGYLHDTIPQLSPQDLIQLTNDLTTSKIERWYVSFTTFKVIPN